MYTVNFFILIFIAITNLCFVIMIQTENFKSMLLFKLIPTISAFYLGLLAFKVFQ